MRILSSLFIVLCFLSFGARSSSAQISLGVHGGYNLDAFSDEGAAEGAFLLGGQARFGLSGVPIILNPGVDYYFDGIDDVTVFQVNADALYAFGVDNAVFTPYAGLGLAVTRVSFDPDAPLLSDLLDSDETDVGLNLVGGAVFGLGSIRPFGQARITLGSHTAFINEDGDGGPGYALTGGLLLRLGR